MGGVDGMGEIPPVGNPEDSIFSNDPMMADTVDKLVKNAINYKQDSAPIVEDLYDHYILRIGPVIEKINKNWVCKANTEKKRIEICNPKQAQVCINIDDNYLAESILPDNELARMCPYHSSEFYTMIWKPIVEALGHLYFRDENCVFLSKNASLPDLPHIVPSKIGFTVVSRKGECQKSLSFSEDPKCWIVQPIIKNRFKINLKRTAFTELDYFDNGKGAIVICIAPELDIKATGYVEQIIPTEEGNQLDINFGNHVIRLHESKIEKVNANL